MNYIVSRVTEETRDIFSSDDSNIIRYMNGYIYKVYIDNIVKTIKENMVSDMLKDEVTAREISYYINNVLETVRNKKLSYIANLKFASEMLVILILYTIDVFRDDKNTDKIKDMRVEKLENGDIVLTYHDISYNVFTDDKIPEEFASLLRFNSHENKCLLAMMPCFMRRFPDKKHYGENTNENADDIKWLKEQFMFTKLYVKNNKELVNSIVNDYIYNDDNMKMSMNFEHLVYLHLYLLKVYNYTNVNEIPSASILYGLGCLKFVIRDLSGRIDLSSFSISKMSEIYVNHKLGKIHRSLGIKVEISGDKNKVQHLNVRPGLGHHNDI